VGIYKERTSGQCSDGGGGWESINSIDECTTGAIALRAEAFNCDSGGGYCGAGGVWHDNCCPWVWDVETGTCNDHFFYMGETQFRGTGHPHSSWRYYSETDIPANRDPIWDKIYIPSIKTAVAYELDYWVFDCFYNSKKCAPMQLVFNTPDVGTTWISGQGVANSRHGPDCSEYQKCICTLKCQPGKYNDQTGQTACKTCATGQYSTVGASSCYQLDASTCPFGTYSSNTSTVCDQCGTGKFNNLNNQISQTSCKSCPVGQYQNEEGQRLCNNGCVSPMVITSDARCIDNRVYKERTSGQCGDSGGEGKITSAAACEAGAAELGWGGTTVVTESYSHSPPGCYFWSGTLYFNTANPNVACSSGKKCLCTLVCPPGTYQDQSGQTSCKNCPIDKFSNDGSSKCDYDICPAGTYVTGVSPCKHCPAGMYSDQTNQTSCKTCASGTYSSAGSDDASSCFGIYKEITSGNCGDSGGGWGKITSAAACEAVSVVLGLGDTFAATMSSSDYPPGCFYSIPLLSAFPATLRFNQADNQTDNIVCNSGHKCLCTLTCLPGTYQDLINETSCKSCASGQYQDQSEKSSCKTCDSGQFQAQSGQSICTPCASGQYQAQSGQSSCTSCGTGKYNGQTRQTSESIACKTCTDGQFQDQIGQPSCKTCANGEFQDHRGQSSCKTCASSTETWIKKFGSLQPNVENLIGGEVEYLKVDKLKVTGTLMIGGETLAEYILKSILNASTL